MESATLSLEQNRRSAEPTIPVNGWVLFAFVSALYVGLTFLSREFVLTEQLYYNTYGERLAADRIREMIQMQEQYAWLGYIVAPFFVVLRDSYVALCLSVGAILMEHEEMTFRRLFKVALICEGIFLLQSALTTFWNAVIVSPETLQEAGTALPVSLAALVNPDQLPQWTLYPLQSANLFEILYVAALSATLTWTFGKEAGRMSVLTIASYGIGLLLWIAAATFFLVQVT